VVARHTPASIVVTCFTDKRWSQLAAAIDSVLRQTLAAQEVIVVVDGNDDLLSRVEHRWPQIRVMANHFQRGASGARNTGAFHARSPVVAFVDDDAEADPKWLELLVQCFEDGSVVGVGGGVTAAWADRKPSWFPDEFAWVVGVSYRDPHDDVVVEVRNVWAENMAVRRERFLAVGGFRLGFGKVGTRSSPEDTDLCIRMALDGGRWLYVPAAQVAHHVPADRSTLGFFLRRCFVEGAGKATLAQLMSSELLSTERDYLRQVIPRAIYRDLREAVVCRRLPPAAQACTMVAGLTSAAAGYARGQLLTTRWCASNTDAGQLPQPPGLRK
jgi:glucosyl-dolichyl phosphate glucuronosyltransferase